MVDAISLPFDPEETWRPVVGYEALYEVSDYGRVRKISQSPRSKVPAGYMLSVGSRKGYPTVQLIQHGRRDTREIHRLVARAFIGPCPTGYEVNHKDGDKINNRPANLEYVTKGENAQHGHRTGLIPPPPHLWGEAHGASKLKAEQVAEIRRRYRRNGRYGNSPELAREFGISQRNIRRVVSGEIWKEVL